jgi:hypothetical protein
MYMHMSHAFECMFVDTPTTMNVYGYELVFTNTNTCVCAYSCMMHMSMREREKENVEACICMFEYIHTFMDLYLHEHTYAHMYANTHMLNVHLIVCVLAHVSGCVIVHTCTRTHACASIFIHIITFIT